MHLQYTELLLGLPEVNVKKITPIHPDTLQIELVPEGNKQACPLCQSKQNVIRKGANKTRRVRHLSSFGKRVYLCLPAIRLYCKDCDCNFSWNYPFVGEKKRYTYEFEETSGKMAAGSTSKHAACMQQIPPSTAFHMHEKWVEKESTSLQQTVWEKSKTRQELVLGVDDFAIRKGHTYNTGIHDLRGETILSILPGRKRENLHEYAKQHPDFLSLQPKAVVMDLYPTYHQWIQKCFPQAVRIADRFHVVRYVHTALQEIRKEVQSELKPMAAAKLKKFHRFLNPRSEQLTKQSKQTVLELLGYSDLLAQAYHWKEALNEWYDYSSAPFALSQFQSWCRKGDSIHHLAVDLCLRTMRNWQTEIVNYHFCRFTNASVEGRHNKIKAYQRRHFFTRNRANYISGLYVECNQGFLSSTRF